MELYGIEVDKVGKVLALGLQNFVVIGLSWVLHLITIIIA